MLIDNCTYLGFSSDWTNSSRSLKPCRFFDSPKQKIKVAQLTLSWALLLVLISIAVLEMLVPASYLLSLLALHKLLSFHMIYCTRLYRSPSRQHSRQSSAITTAFGDCWFPILDELNKPSYYLSHDGQTNETDFRHGGFLLPACVVYSSPRDRCIET